MFNIYFVGLQKILKKLKIKEDDRNSYIESRIYNVLVPSFYRYKRENKYLKFRNGNLGDYK